MNLGIDVLTGNTTAITPTQVKEAILNGRPVSITYTDTTYGNLTFTSFGYSVENNVVVANLVSTYNTQYILADLVGMSNNDQWTLQTTELGTLTDIDNFELRIADNYVKYSESQTLTDEQKQQPELILELFLLVSLSNQTGIRMIQQQKIISRINLWKYHIGKNLVLGQLLIVVLKTMVI